MAQAIYTEWFVKFKFPATAGRPGHETATFYDSGTEYVEIPEGWEVVPLEKIALITMGQSPKSEYYNDVSEGLPFHQGVSNFNDRYPNHTKFCDYEKVRIAEKGDILFSVRAPVGRINISPTKIVIGRGLSALRSKQNAQSFLFYLLKDRFKEVDQIGNGAIFNSITKSDIVNYKILRPKIELSLDFNSKVTPIDNEINNLTNQTQTLRELRDTLLPKLVSGEVEV
jgi:type I restriction enzyme S subunit